MSELLFLLFNGPTLQAAGLKTERDYSAEKLPSQAMIDEYRKYSDGRKIWSLLITANKPIKTTTASRQLRAMKNIGLLKEVGRLKGTRSSSPPFIYEWVQ